VRKTAYILSVVLGSLLIIGGVATWIVVSTTLADQKIVVSDDASCLAGDEVDGPFSAYCEAMVIDKHALEATGGLRYAELDREDPKRQTAMTASFLQASLFTSVVAFGVAAMAIAVGVLFILIGLGSGTSPTGSGTWPAAPRRPPEVGRTLRVGPGRRARRGTASMQWASVIQVGAPIRGRRLECGPLQAQVLVGGLADRVQHRPTPQRPGLST
jgi:hypothetical protein